MLRRRIQAVHKQLAPDAPLLVSLYTREKPRIVPGLALAIDWSQHFVPRDAPQTVWDTRLLPALRRISEACKDCASGRTTIADGKCEIPAAVALGTIYLAPRGLPIVWRQFKRGLPTQDWSLDAAAEPCGFTVTLENNDVAGDDLAVLVSVATDVRPAFGASRGGLPAFRGHVVVAPPHDLTTPGQARDLVDTVIAALHRARSERQGGAERRRRIAGQPPAEALRSVVGRNRSRGRAGLRHAREASGPSAQSHVRRCNRAARDRRRHAGVDLHDVRDCAAGANRGPWRGGAGWILRGQCGKVSSTIVSLQHRKEEFNADKRRCTQIIKRHLYMNPGYNEFPYYHSCYTQTICVFCVHLLVSA